MSEKNIITGKGSPKIIRGLKLIGWQKDFASAFESLRPDEKLFVVSGRQRGKSTALLQIILYVAINRPKSQSYFISPVNFQNRSRFKDLASAIAGSPLVSKLNESNYEARFVNGSSVTFLSAESGDNLRGNTCARGGVLIIDECAFVKDETITSILTPYVTVHHANIIAVSTPRQKNGWFYEGVRDAKACVPGYKVIDVSEYNSSFFITEEQIEDYRRKYPPVKFRNEIEGLFADKGSGVFGDYQSVFKSAGVCEPVYIGIDWSTGGGDYTVVAGFDKDLEMCLLWKDNKIDDPLKRADQIAELLNLYPSIKKVIVEKNSIGAVYSSYLKTKYVHPNRIDEFVTSNSSKVRIIEQLVSYINQRKLTLLPDSDLDYQFGIFEHVPLTKGYTYAADPRASNSHDDVVMATAFALEAAIANQKSGGYSFSFI